MTTYTAIANADIDADSPVTAPLMTAMRDNPIAITEGASGAPKVQDAALDTTVTSAGTDWVLARTAGATAGAVGTYACAATDIVTAFGATIAGSNLSPSDTSVSATGSLSGTWQCCGRIPSAIGDRATLWLRIV